jgi:signal transduction histidine kinase
VGETYTPAHVAAEIAPASSVPIVGLYDPQIGTGVLGVNVSPFEEEGFVLGKVIRQILSGAKPEDIGILPTSPTRLILDARAMQRWGIKSAPAGAEVRYQTPSLWEEHRGLVIGAIVVFAVQAALIAGLLAQRVWRRRVEKEARELRQELTHASRVTLLGTLASSLAHELNQPLGAILRNAEAAELFLQSDAPDLDELRAIVADIRKDDQRAGGVIDRLRALLKRREFEPRPVSLDDLVAEVVTLTHADSVTRHVGLALDLPLDLPLVLGDRIHLQQVLLNLLVNGMDALAVTPDGERSLTLRAQATDAGFVEVAVSDNGPGIPAEKLSRLFEPFFTTKPQGMGLGLPISRTIIEAHGGKLWGENNVQRGATFRFTLPAAVRRVA